MVPRYEQQDMTAVWSEEAKFSNFLKVEIALLESLEKINVAPKGVAQAIQSKAKINPARINEIEATTHHDVIAFCTSITENLDPSEAKWFHFGCTSSDIIDTALSLQLKDAINLILPTYKKVLHQLRQTAEKHKNLLTIGRSHGMYAEPMSFGQKFLSAYTEMSRRFSELEDFSKNEITGKMSGAVGNYTILSPALEADVLKRVGLSCEPVSTQIVPRDRLAKFVSLAALFASALERFEIEIRHLHRSDVNELYEGFAPGQKGSSTMPHKKNPIAAENLSGIARLMRGYLSVAHENVLLWHERDISHSSAERLYLPDLCGLWLYSLRRLSKQLDMLHINEEVVKAKAQSAYQSLSSFYLHSLLPEWKGHREELYTLIQKAAFEATDAKSFQASVEKHTNLKLPSQVTLESVYLKAVDETFKRVDATYPLPVI
ncbi:MAG: adenylosuccinate lyase [Bacteriovoracaceae bacterium]|nr:adenylosuccinate lyase [Bacteriovoracaceae bacterium]